MTVKMELSSQTHQCEAWQQQREPVARRLTELTELNKRRHREHQEHLQRIQAAQQEIAESTQLAENKTVIHATILNMIEANKVKRAEAINLITGLDAQLRVLRSEQNELHESRSGDEVALAEQKVLLTQLRERYQRDHQKELEDLPRLTETDSGANWAELELGAREKRTALEAMGPVNLEAISEYDELEGRQKFLTAQEADLVQSRDQLMQAIREINQTTQRLFADTFQQIRKNFQEMFVELFGGGKADLLMLDESDPLESGIDILAKPPGKQPQSISLLSGGEKTMTAVALLFSIYLVKPSPFCVLDEMDAPLDESNINRFIKILQRFVHQSQFVVITHNKRTISIADVLYGVTMEERGVSRFVSMRLSKNATVPTDPGSGESAAATDRDDGVPSLAEAVAGN
jgi:chromosome segregation protein